MSRARAYKQESLDVQKRYFDIVQEMLDSDKLPGGIAGLCEISGIDRRNWYTQRKDNGKGYFEVAWLIPLIKYYKVSATWLLLGTGKIYKGTK